jgi:hypothetical protein
MQSYFKQWVCIFPGKMGLSWKLASGPYASYEEAQQQAEKNANVCAVPYEFFEKYQESEKRMVQAENTANMLSKHYGMPTVKVNNPDPCLTGKYRSIDEPKDET